MLLFKQIKLKNFRQYYGEQSLSFSTNSDKNITIIHGNNGAGKSSLFYAINWCLYGDVDPDIGSLVSKELAFNSEFGSRLVAQVELWIEKERQVFRIQRECVETKEHQSGSANKGNFSLVRQADGDSFRAYYLKGSEFELSPEPILLINSILPSNAREYFLFNGEKIEQLTKPGHERDVIEAVRNILQLPSLERAIEHVTEVEKDIAKEARLKFSGSAESDIFDKQLEVNAAIADINKQLSEYNEFLEAAQIRKQDFVDKLREVQSVKPLTDLRDTIQKQLKTLDDDYSKCRFEIKQHVSQSYLIILKSKVTNLLARLQKLQDSNMIPPPIDKSFIDDLLAVNKCICGNDLSNGTSGRATIDKYLLSLGKISDSAHDLSELQKSLLVIEEKNINITESFKHHCRESLELQEKISTSSSKLEELHKEISGSLDVEASTLEYQIQTTDDELIRIKGDIRILKDQLCKEEKNLKNLDVELQKIQKDKAKKNKYITYQQLLSRSKDVLAKCFNDFAQIKRLEIQVKMQEIFLKIISKNMFFKKVELTSDYRIYVEDIYSSAAINELSAGERQVLSLSFITAMASVTGGRIPLIMDTPFGRLFRTHRENIINALPSLTNQWILLVQNEEVSGDLLRMLSEKAGKQYDLEFESGCTTIKELI